MRKQASAGSKFNHCNVLRRAQSAPHLVELPSQKAAENRVYIARSIEIAGLAELLRIARIVAELRIVEAKLHIAREGNGAALADFLFDLPA